jgi:purine-binding chemotaxis protein CheW
MAEDKPEKRRKSKPAEPVAKGETRAAVLPPCGLAEDILGAAAPREPSAPPSPVAPPNRNRISGPDQNEKEAKEKFVTFFLEREEYALPIKQVQEINRVGEITRLPNAPAQIAGVINLRGRIIPVIELKRRLQLGPTQLTKDSRIVVVEYGPKLFGLLVDQVSEVLHLSASQIEAVPEEVASGQKNYLRGVGKLANRMIILLELTQLMARDQS